MVALAGGTGSAKLIRGLASLECELTVVANVGDNLWMHGLYVCPDIDIPIYTLAGVEDRSRGWGIEGDTHAVLGQLATLGRETWFTLGDRDIATHILRTAALREGRTLTQATEELCRSYGLKARVLPATDSPLETRVITREGEMNLQEFWVRRRGMPHVVGVRYKGAASSAVTAQVEEAIRAADDVVVCPANPVSSIGPILAVRGISELLSRARARVSALSPMVGHAPYSGPAAKFMKATGTSSNSIGVANLYLGFLDAIMIDRRDENMAGEIQRLGIECRLSDTRLGSRAAERRVARELLDA
ncbi:MAG TPA: 2-phospho-L-lactate transferase [Nitrososphaerales archaeon]|nr:2-phospho-L-lactate transferase [Nitrososphaerales archaeon]